MNQITKIKASLKREAKKTGTHYVKQAQKQGVKMRDDNLPEQAKNYIQEALKQALIHKQQGGTVTLAIPAVELKYIDIERMNISGIEVEALARRQGHAPRDLDTSLVGIFQDYGRVILLNEDLQVINSEVHYKEVQTIVEKEKKVSTGLKPKEVLKIIENVRHSKLKTWQKEVVDNIINDIINKLEL